MAQLQVPVFPAGVRQWSALPALLTSGLWQHTEEHFQLPPGHYRWVHLFLLVAFLALAGVKSLESLRYCAPGEWGKVLGQDRIPEVRTLREKLQWLGQEDKVGAWAARLPRHYVSRQRLCLRATTDYWVNAMDGQPFFVVHRPVDPGLLQVLEQDVIPRLARFGAMNLAGPIDPEAVESFLGKKAARQQEIEALRTQLRERKAQRSAVDQPLPLGQVPEAERFERLSSGSKDLVDTIKRVAYRAETAMAHVLREALPK